MYVQRALWSIISAPELWVGELVKLKCSDQLRVALPADEVDRPCRERRADAIPVRWVLPLVDSSRGEPPGSFRQESFNRAELVS